MSKQLLTAVVALVVGIVIGAAVLTAKPNLGGVTIEDETFVGTVTINDAVVSDDLSVTDDLTVAKDLILTDNDFCIQLYATSTATAVKMVASTTVASGSNIGVFTMQYGSCVE